jgi:hypothetical protein
MKKLEYCKYWLSIVSVVLFPTASGTGQTYITGGDVSGSWTSAGSPYYIQGEITIPNSETLTIEPAVEVVFMGHYKLNVQGRLLAVGTQQDSISFTADSIEIGWHGVRFINTPVANDTSKFVYCSFKYGKANTGSSWDRCGGAILIGTFNKVFISDCLFENNENYGDISTTGGAAIFLKYASPIITNCTFRSNQGTTDCSVLCANSFAVISKSVFSNNSGPHGPIFCYYDSSTVLGNIISNNTTTRAGGGIFALTSHSIITNNIIFGNSCFGGEGEGGGIKCWLGDKSIIINNTIAYNSAAHGGGICCNNNSDAIFINNIIWGNTSPDGAQVNLLEATSDPDFFFCDIQGGKEEFGGNGAGVNYTGQYENNIDSDPLFVDTTSSNFRLTDSSPCIGAGIDSIEVGSTMYYCPPFCFYGGSRPNPVGSMPDIGACESPLGTSGVEDEESIPNAFALQQNYPNPFNPVTNIQYAVSSRQFVKLTVYDVLGNEIATLADEYKPAGKYEVEFNASTLPSGVYFYQLKAGDFIQTRKMILLK